MRDYTLWICLGIFVVSVQGFGCAESDTVGTPADEDMMTNPDMSVDDTGTPDMGEADGGETGEDMGADTGPADMGGDASRPDMTAELPPGPNRFTTGASGAQRLGSEQYRLGVSVGAPGAPTLESEEYRLRLGPQPHLVRPGARPSATE